VSTRLARSGVSTVLLVTGGFLSGHVCAVVVACLALTPLAVPQVLRPTREPSPPGVSHSFHTPPVFQWDVPDSDLAAEPGDAAPPALPEQTVRRRQRPQQSDGLESPAAAADAPLDMSPRARAHREVRRDEDGVWLIPRELLMTVANDRSLMRGQARRVTPWFEDGACQGVRVEGAGALLALVGIRDGDIITRAGGIVIDSPHRGLAAWDMLRARSEVQLEVLRRGRRIRLSYRLVEDADAEGSTSSP
jgi:hypothetical protein